MSAGQSCEQHPMAVGFTVADMKKSLAFYRDKLGFELKECWPNEAAPMWANVLLDGQSIMFGQAMPAAEMEKMCGGDPVAGKFWAARANEFAKNVHGAGVNLYVMVPDIDAYAAKLKSKGVTLALTPKTQFYGLRDCVVSDPDGYTLTFYTPVKMESCQSCAMPLADAKPGQMYCAHCTDASGHLKPYEQVLEGTVSGYFMAHMKLPRAQAEKAAREHLAKQPAWSRHG